jgi:S-adenosylmethionine hydrolase
VRVGLHTGEGQLTDNDIGRLAVHMSVIARSGIVTLTTDFGFGGPYAAALEAALITTWPLVRVVHVSHGIRPGDVRSGAYVVEYAARSFPPGTVHLGVVDPGVGTGRPMVAIETETFVVVGPGNGVLDRALRGHAVQGAVTLSEPADGVSRTFQSRDVMAPAAARAAAGEMLSSLGATAEIAVAPRAPTFDPAVASSFDVAYVDSFGTLVIDAVHPVRWPEGVDSVQVAAQRVALGLTFADVAPGELVMYPGSIGYVEIAARDGSAASLLGLGAGDRVSIAP